MASQVNCRMAALLSVEEYLRTSYEPDIEFVDGVLVERNAGDWLHSLMQSNVLLPCDGNIRT